MRSRAPISAVIATVLLLYGCSSDSDSSTSTDTPSTVATYATEEPTDEPTEYESSAPSTAPSVSATAEGPTAPGTAPSRRRLEVVPSSGKPRASELPTVPGALGDSGNTIDQVTLESVTQYAKTVIVDADKVWSNWMMGLGYPEPYVSYAIIQPDDPLVAQKCPVQDPRQNGAQTTTIDSAFPNAFYCGAHFNGEDNGIVILPVESLAKMWSGDILGKQVSDPAKVGDFAAATIVAHEFGHHVEDELSEDMNMAAPQGKNKELLADCFAGVWATALYREGNLERGDLDEALNALEAIGDQPGTTPTQPHGNAAERDEAFRLGIYGSQSDPRGGVPGICIRHYWSSFTGPI